MPPPALKTSGGNFTDFNPPPASDEKDGFKGFTRADGSRENAAAVAAA
jgi:hypothetical protein